MSVPTQDARRSDEALPRPILIAGPTASGKSGLALALARHVGGVLINADALQVYRELRILTARPTPEDEAALPHRLYGIVSAREAYSVGRWLADVAVALAEARQRGLRPILVGGTGLYFTALTEGLVRLPPVPAAVRDAVRAQLAAEGPEALRAALASLDPGAPAPGPPRDPQRLARALEVLIATGRPLRDWQGAPQTPLLPLAAVRAIVLAPARAALYQRIDARLGAMIEAGALAEVEALRAQGLDPGLPAWRALGVAPLAAHLAGALPLADALAAAQQATRRYAKRQMTWLRNKMLSWNWVETQFSETLDQDIIAKVTEAG